MIFCNFKKLIVALTFISAVSVVKLQAQTNQDFNLTKNLDIFFSAFRELRALYVDSLKVDALIRSSINGMTEQLDPYTEFVPEEEVGDFDFSLTGRYAGIGAIIQRDSNYVRIAEPYKGFPAQQAGLVSGDRLIELDGKDLKNVDINKVSDMLKGDPGTKVNLKVIKLRGNDTVNLTIKRQRIQLSGIIYSGMLNDGVGYIRLTSFTEGCSRDFRDALMDLRKTGNLKSLVIDLRSNGGGSLDEAVKIVNLFVPKGIEIVSARGRDETSNRSYVTKDQPVDLQLPLAVLVNSGTASSSEIVSGAIQDLDRGVIIGTRTFGKGLVQTVRPTGYNTKLKITIAKYYIPSGRCVQAHNFSQRNQDGSVAFIPDSLKKEFKTQNGRSVFDGGGIAPDIRVESGEYSPIAVGLLSKNLIFDYSLKYYIKHLSIAEPSEFSITDDDYKDFISFLSDKPFDYQKNSERLLKQLIETVKTERYYDETKAELNILSEKLKHDKDKDLQTFKPELVQLLNEEIVNRYYYQAGRIRTMLRSDVQLDSAIKALKNREEYTTILTKIAPSNK